MVVTGTNRDIGSTYRFGLRVNTLTYDGYVESYIDVQTVQYRLPDLIITTDGKTKVNPTDRFIMTGTLNLTDEQWTNFRDDTWTWT